MSEHSVQNFDGEPVRLLNLHSFADRVLCYGEIEWLVASRPFLDNLVADFLAPLQIGGSTYSVYHAYGMGGAGITLSPALAIKLLRDLHQYCFSKGKPVTIVGAGVVGLTLAEELLNAGYQDITLVAEIFPRGVESVFPSFKPLTHKANYPSRVPVAYIMPVSVGPYKDERVWKGMLTDAQSQWEGLLKDSPYRSFIQPSQRIVFSDLPESEAPHHNYATHEVNKILGFQLYPLSVNKDRFFLGSGGDLYRRRSETLLRFENVLQVDTLSFLLKKLERLRGSPCIQLYQKKLCSAEDLLCFLKEDAFVINASGHGLKQVFKIKEVRPVRGDGIVLSLPEKFVRKEEKAQSHYSYWAAGKYIHQNFVEGEGMKLLLGGSFLEGDYSLEANPEIITGILTQWYRFFQYRHDLPELFPPGVRHCCHNRTDVSDFVTKIMKNMTAP